MIRRPPRSTLFPYTSSSDLRSRCRPGGQRLPPERPAGPGGAGRSEEHTSELQSHSDLVCRLLLEKKKKKKAALRTAASRQPVRCKPSPRTALVSVSPAALHR